MRSLLLLPVITFALLVSHSQAQNEAPTDSAAEAKPAKIKVTVPIPPYAFLVKAIGGEHVDVMTLIDASQDPHSFNLTPKQTIEIGESDLFITSGMEFEEQFIYNIADELPDLKWADINKGLEMIESVCIHHGDEEEEDEHHEHEHALPDPHTWTSPSYLGMQAITVSEALTKLAPNQKDAFNANLVSVLEKIQQVERQVAATLKPHKGKDFYVFHPAFGYFSREYGLNEKAIEVGGKQPTARQLLEIIQEAGADKAKAIFIEPQFESTAAREVAKQIGAKIVMVDPLQEDILGTLTEFSKNLAEVLSD